MAQLVEQLTVNQWVTGSSPIIPASLKLLVYTKSFLFVYLLIKFIYFIIKKAIIAAKGNGGFKCHS